MSLAEWAKNGWLRPHKSSHIEIDNLLKIVDRDIHDANTKGLSDDWKFGIAYNAALKLCTILLHGSGYRSEKNLAHYRTIQALPLILGHKHSANADYLDTCRKKRNETEYDMAGGVSREEVKELVTFCIELRLEVIKWLEREKR